LGHKAWCANQNQAILAGEEDMIARCQKDKKQRQAFAFEACCWFQNEVGSYVSTWTDNWELQQMRH
jgi:hypothetical protein